MSGSSSWSLTGNYSMGLEMNLGYSDNATYGLDTLALGLSNANGSPQIESQVVAAFETDDYYVGLFGLGHQGVNFSEYSTPNATFLATLKEQNMIPSLSWGYTAGAIYREYRFRVRATGDHANSSGVCPTTIAGTYQFPLSALTDALLT